MEFGYSVHVNAIFSRMHSSWTPIYQLGDLWSTSIFLQLATIFLELIGKIEA